MDRYRITYLKGYDRIHQKSFDSWCLERLSERGRPWLFSLMGLKNHDYLRENQLNGAIITNPRLDTRSGKPEFHEMANLLSYNLLQGGRL